MRSVRTSIRSKPVSDLLSPDVYEVGMSHLGLKILYSILNNKPDLVAERLFAPMPDMERLMRSEGVPLKTLESGDSCKTA